MSRPRGFLHVLALMIPGAGLAVATIELIRTWEV